MQVKNTQLHSNMQYNMELHGYIISADINSLLKQLEWLTLASLLAFYLWLLRHVFGFNYVDAKPRLFVFTLHFIQIKIKYRPTVK